MRFSFSYPHILVFLIGVSCTTAQTNNFSKYLQGFKQLDAYKIIEFQSILNLRSKMTRSEALEFVYFGDTTLLSCNQKVINMENERDFRITRTVYLPEKCFKIDVASSLLIAYTAFDCQDIKKRLFQTMTLVLLDRSLKKTDSLVVHKSDDYDFEFSGILNPEAKTIFLVGKMKDKDVFHAELFLIDHGKFVLKKRSEKLSVSFDSFEKYLAHLNWDR